MRKVTEKEIQYILELTRKGYTILGEQASLILKLIRANEKILSDPHIPYWEQRELIIERVYELLN